MIASLTGKRARSLAAVLLTLSLLTLALSGCAKAPKPAAPPAPPSQPPAKATESTLPADTTLASWEELQTTLEAAVKSKMYQNGSKAAAKSYYISPWTEEGRDKSYVLAVDFAQSLTRQQFEQMQMSGKLPFADLRKEQQNLLKSFAELFPPGNPAHEQIQKSYVVIVRFQYLWGTTGTGLHLGLQGKSGKATRGIFCLEPNLILN
jgi:hypothetical protein